MEILLQIPLPGRHYTQYMVKLFLVYNTPPIRGVFEIFERYFTMRRYGMHPFCLTN